MGKEASDEPKVTSGLWDDLDEASDNVNRALVNPFGGKSHKEMNDLIDAFMEKTKIDEIYQEHIRKGAFLAQDSEAFNDLREDGLQLKPEEKAALVLENPKTGNKWNQPWILWLLAKARQGKTDKYETAFTSLCRLRHTRLQAARDLFLMHHLLDNEERIKRNHNIFFELWSVPRNRRALTASLILMFFQQFCGVNVLAYYSSSVFADAGLKGQEPLLASMGFGIINFLFAIPAFYTIDTFGRRNLLLCTFPFMAIFQLLTGLGFLLEGKAQLALVMTGMYLFSVAYSPGEGPVPFLYSAESMPLYVRDVGMSMATALTWFFNFLLAVTFPKFQDAFSNTGAFGYYAAWCMIGWVLILLFVPETKDLTLEQLDARFSISSKSHARFAVRQCAFAIRYYILRRRRTKRPTMDLPPQDVVYGDGEADQPRKISFDKDERILTS
ncbi:MAG: hypothetical protein Q9207_006106 [Kuettlingeria erythrocarpa]